MIHQRPPQPQRPRVEPEIIPPDRSYRRDEGGAARIWVSRGRHRIHIARPGPFAFILAALMLGGIAAMVFALVVGAFLIALPVAAFLAVSLLLARVFRGQASRGR
jgi:hypothetical protein